MNRVRGERHPQHKLTEREAREVYRLTHQTTLSLREIAQMYDIHKATVQWIKEGRNWKWLNGVEKR